jgi:hypothetical protein
MALGIFVGAVGAAVGRGVGFVGCRVGIELGSYVGSGVGAPTLSKVRSTHVAVVSVTWLLRVMVVPDTTVTVVPDGMPLP